MKALIVYASWFGHNRSIARQIAADLSDNDVIVDCIPVTKVSAHDLAEYNLLVLGTYTHAGQASRRMRALCETIPLRIDTAVDAATYTPSPAQPHRPHAE